MKKSLWFLSCVAFLPLAVCAADANKSRDGGEHQRSAAAEAAASAPTRAHAPMSAASAAEQRAVHQAELRGNQERGARMVTCRKQALEGGLRGVELKMALADCMKQP